MNWNVQPVMDERLSIDDGNGNENVTSWKSNFALLLLLRDYSSSSNLYNVGEVSRN